MIDPVKQSGLDTSGPQALGRGPGKNVDVFDPEGLFDAAMKGATPFQQELPLDEILSQPLDEILSQPSPQDDALHHASGPIDSQEMESSDRFDTSSTEYHDEAAHSSEPDTEKSEKPSDNQKSEKPSDNLVTERTGSSDGDDEVRENRESEQAEESPRQRQEGRHHPAIGFEKRTELLAGRGPQKQPPSRPTGGGARESMLAKQEAKSATLARLLSASQVVMEGSEQQGQGESELNVQVQAERKSNPGQQTDSQGGNNARRSHAVQHDTRGRHVQGREGKSAIDEASVRQQTTRVQRQGDDVVQGERSVDIRQVRADLASAVSQQSTRDLARFGRQSKSPVNGPSDAAHTASAKTKSQRRMEAAQAQSEQREQSSAQDEQRSNEKGAMSANHTGSPSGVSSSAVTTAPSAMTPVVGSYAQAVNQSAVAQASNGAATQDTTGGQGMKGARDGLVFVDSSGGDDAVIRLSDTDAGKLEVRVRRDGENLSLRLKAEDPNQRQQMLDGMSELRRELTKSDLVEGRVDVAEFGEKDDNYNSRDSRSEQREARKSDGSMDSKRAESGQTQEASAEHEAHRNSENRLHIIA